MQCQIDFISCFTNAQIHNQVTESPWIFLNVSGLRYCRWETQEGTLLYDAKDPGAFLMLVPPGNRVSFEYSQFRENWVCGLRNLSLRQRQDRVELEDQGVWTPMAQRIPLTPDAAQLWAIEMHSLRETMRTPLPRNALLGRLILSGIIRFFLEALPADGSRTPAQHLREQIDTDETCRISLDTMSAECGYSSDHLRLRFQEEFGITPQRYRMQRRMAKAMDLVTGTTLSVKQISIQLGFPYVAHFSTAFRLAFGYSPSEAIRRYRQHS